MSEFDNSDEIYDDDDYETLTMQDENGNDVEFLIVDIAEHNGNNYILVIESDTYDEDEVEAVILKETKEYGKDTIYEILEDGDEFNTISALFQDNEDYQIEL